MTPKSSKYFSNKQISWLYCVPKYPCKFDEIDFSLLKSFHGFSNHCKNMSAPLEVINLNSEILEIHITSDKNGDFIDNNVSFDYSEMKEIANLIDGVIKNIDDEKTISSTRKKVIELCSEFPINKELLINEMS